MEQLSLNTPLFIFSLLLLLGVLWINGLTDAPNAIASALLTRAMSLRQAVLLGALFNLLGVMTAAIYPDIVLSVTELSDLGKSPYAQIGISAALASIVIWSMTAHCLGIPTSESHALFAGLCGASVGIGIIPDTTRLLSLLSGLLLSVTLGFLSGYIGVTAIKRLCRKKQRYGISLVLRRSERVNACIMSFLHGCQDGQKFIGVFILLLELFGKKTDSTPVILPVLCAVIMASGTLAGGKRVILSLGKMTKVTLYEGFAGDTGGNLAILISTLLGFPISTTHAKTAALIGAATGNSLKRVRWDIASDMLWAWLLTFPACGTLGYFISKLILTFIS